MRKGFPIFFISLGLLWGNRLKVRMAVSRGLGYYRFMTGSPGKGDEKGATIRHSTMSSVPRYRRVGEKLHRVQPRVGDGRLRWT
ncbi:hypothetical protein K450DRAFT_221029 [Umbelopsis ramanniana AG]|uniref:Secreted protein n=1 Tax=Umbelopsis ramanniana AG TaxID=1314678 RepID=A0AAD5EHJ9_UMBRA|nr:uncharacterized protein K450DRAFT_221029 [Umbelopsis ramanniana AG]KAI8584001.1 hypothetical protein K450DRAFT_221029 [Umbelopsis ramanniana AG]